MKKKKRTSEFFRPSIEFLPRENETLTSSDTTNSSRLVTAIDSQVPCEIDSPSFASSPFHSDDTFTFPTTIIPNLSTERNKEDVFLIQAFEIRAKH